MFKIAIIGLGLMGGSLAYALHGFRECKRIGYDIDESTTQQALERGAIDHIATSLEGAVHETDLSIFCSGPDSIIHNMHVCLPFFKDGSIVTEVCGVKHEIMEFITVNLPENIHYAGLHPMAGKEVGGFANADPSIFKGAGFILIKPNGCPNNVELLLKELSFYVGAGRVVTNTLEEHDALIAYTSDLMHIAATAICADYPANMTMAHTAGAFRDCTRVARIDADLWTPLLTKNAGNIIPCLEIYIDNLTQFKQALINDDKPFIHEFLRAASENKEKMLEL